MKKIFTLALLFLLSFSVRATVDIQEYFAASSTGSYLPYSNNGTITLKFDFIVDQGPVGHSFVVAFVLSEDMNVFDHNDILIDSVRISNVPNGSSEFPTNFLMPAPYRIEQMLKKANIDHSKSYFVGCILDYNNEIAEANENNNSGPIQMPPVTISGNVGINTDLGFWESSINPNPVHNYSIISVQGEQTLEHAVIQIYAMDGRLVREIQDVQFPYTFYREDMAFGTYQLVILNDNKAILRKKIIIQ